jgi:hypothetical protein
MYDIIEQKCCKVNNKMHAYKYSNTNYHLLLKSSDYNF